MSDDLKCEYCGHGLPSESTREDGCVFCTKCGAAWQVDQTKPVPTERIRVAPGEIELYDDARPDYGEGPVLIGVKYFLGDCLEFGWLGLIFNPDERESLARLRLRSRTILKGSGVLGWAIYVAYCAAWCSILIVLIAAVFFGNYGIVIVSVVVVVFAALPAQFAWSVVCRLRSKRIRQALHRRELCLYCDSNLPCLGSARDSVMCPGCGHENVVL